MKIKQIPLSERPYEKLEMYGAHTLSNAELLAIIIKSGTKDESSVTLAQKILSMHKSNDDNLVFLQDVSIKDFMSIKGIGKVKAIQLLAVCELAKRISRPVQNPYIQIKSPQDVGKLLINELRFEKKEQVKTIILNSKNIVLKISDISLGSTNSAMIEPREIFIEAIKIGAPKVILVHNHPSGDATPSKADFEVTERIKKAADILGIQLLDHIVIGKNKYESIFTILKTEK